MGREFELERHSGSANQPLQGPLCYRFNTASQAGPGISGLCRVSVSQLEMESACVTNRMSQQPESTSPTLAVSSESMPGQAGEPTPAQAPQPEGHSPQRIPRWLVRIELLLRVMLRMYIGLAVCYAPWSPAFWDHNPLFLQFPTLSNIAGIGAVRGIVSGLGLLNLWVALEDILGRREMRREGR